MSACGPASHSLLDLRVCHQFAVFLRKFLCNNLTRKLESTMAGITDPANLGSIASLHLSGKSWAPRACALVYVKNDSASLAVETCAALTGFSKPDIYIPIRVTNMSGWRYNQVEELESTTDVECCRVPDAWL